MKIDRSSSSPTNFPKNEPKKEIKAGFAEKLAGEKTESKSTTPNPMELVKSKGGITSEEQKKLDEFKNLKPGEVADKFNKFNVLIDATVKAVTNKAYNLQSEIQNNPNIDDKTKTLTSNKIDDFVTDIQKFSTQVDEMNKMISMMAKNLADIEQSKQR